MAARWKYDLYIDGKWTRGAADQDITVIDPATEEQVGLVPEATVADARAAISTLFDPKLALSAASGLAARGGRVVVSHPLGAPFVKQLRGAMPDLILHELPGKAALAKLVEFEALRVLGVEEEEELYIATLVRTPRRAPQP